MDYLKLIMSVIERTFFMFLHGERMKDIKSMLLVDYANYLHDKENIDKATAYYQKAVNANSRNYYAYGGLAAVHIEKRLFEEALAQCNSAIAIKQDVLLFFLQSVIYDSLGKHDLAEQAFQKTLRHFNNDLVAAYDRLAYTYYEYNMYGRAEHYCIKALELKPNEAGLHYNLAKIYKARGQIQLAKEEFQRVMQLAHDKKYKKYAQEEIRNL